MKIITYTAITGNKDRLKTCPFTPTGEYVCFTDNKNLFASPWKMRIIEPLPNPRRASRKYKILAHKWFPEFEYSLWIDGSIKLKASVEILIDKFLKGYDIAVLKHPQRNCIYKEAETCITLKKGNPEIIKKQMAKYEKEGYPKNNGLYVCGLILRKHNKKVEDFNNSWWSELCKFTNRDQLSFPYALWKTDLKINAISGIDVFSSNQYFKKMRHHV